MFGSVQVDSDLSLSFEMTDPLDVIPSKSEESFFEFIRGLYCNRYAVSDLP